MIWRWFWREWRSPSLLIVWLSLTLSVACVLALGNISSRMEHALDRQGREFLAGDRVLRSSYPADPNWLVRAEQEGLIVSPQLSFMTMAYANGKPILSSVKAVADDYPLYGQLKTQPINLKPKPGHVLVEPRLLALLDSQIGQTIELGDATLKISGELIQEPDAGFVPLQTAPRVLINQADVASTGAVQLGSRLTYRYMFAGDNQAIERFSQYITPLLKPDQRLYGSDDSETTVGQSLVRAQQFLLLSAILTLFLAIAAVIVAMNHYCRSRYDLIAILKTLGAGRVTLRRFIIGQWLSVLLLASIVGCAIGLALEQALLFVLRPVLPTQLPEASWWPWLWSICALIFISLLVGFRPYIQLLATPPSRVFRRESVSNILPLKIYVPIVLSVIGLGLVSLVGFNPLWWGLLFGVLILAIILGLFGWLTLRILRRLVISNLALRLSINRLLRQPSVTVSQLAAFSLSFMLLSVLLLLRGDLLERWQQQIPQDSPNYFLINISDAQVAPVTLFLEQHQIKAQQFYPVIRVRLTEINQQIATDKIKKEDAGFEAVNRELNLTWLKQLPLHNRLVAGNWPPQKNEVSIEEGIAKRLGVKMGDLLTFTGDTLQFSATVTSIRYVNWESLQPNFYFIFPPGGLDGQPQSWITSFRYQGDASLMAQLNRQFPTVSLLDVDRILEQVKQVLNQVSKALEVMVILVIVCGFLLLLAQIQVGMRQRYQELVVYRTLGASQHLLRSTLWYEFALLGLVAGLTATIGAEVALFMLQWKVFDFPWQPNFWLWGGLPLTGMILLSLCGSWLGTRLLNKKSLYRHYGD